MGKNYSLIYNSTFLIRRVGCEVWVRQVGLCVVDELEVFWGYAGDAEGHLGVSEEGDDDALSVDAFYLAFDHRNSISAEFYSVFR